MRRRSLPGTGLEVSEVGLTLSNLSPVWWESAEPGRVERLIQRAFDREVTFFDTADVVGGGAGEEIIGRALRSHRWEVTLATKGGYDFVGSTKPRFLESMRRRRGAGEIEIRSALTFAPDPDSERPQDFRPDALRLACEKSLRRLGTEVIDLYQLHHPRLDALEREEVWETLDELRREGKIRHYGVALGPGPGWAEEGGLALERAGCRTLRLAASPLAPGGLEKLAQEAAGKGAALLVGDVHAFGLFGGPPPPPGAASSAGEEGTGEAFPPPGILRDARGRLGPRGLIRATRSDPEAAVAWALSFPAVASVLIRARTETELAEATAAGQRSPLDSEETARLAEVREEVLSRVPRVLGGSTALRPTPPGSRVRS